MSNRLGFRITNNKGFHITFENGWTISVQFGPGNYCDNYEKNIGKDEEWAGKLGSTTAECAMWGPDGEMIKLNEDNAVTNRSTPEDVLRLINKAASMSKVNE